MTRLVILLCVRLLSVCGSPGGKDDPSRIGPSDKPNMLQCPNTTVTGKDGDTVILPCSTKDKTDISPDTIKWLFKDPTTGEDKDVHTYSQREDQLHKQSDDFKKRTSLFKKELSSGNCSLRLQVTTSHSGEYHCRVNGMSDDCLVNLKVLPAGEEDTSRQDGPVSPDKPNSGTDGLTTTQKVGLGVGIPAALILIVIALVYYYHKHRKQLCPGRKTQPQTHPTVSYNPAR